MLEGVRYHENEISNVLVDIRKKIISNEDIICNNVSVSADKVASVVNERFSLVQSDMKEVQLKIEDTNNDVKELFKSIASQIDSMQKNMQNGIESGNMMLENKTDGILLSLEEVKTLMKIIAVNNLVDEI